MIFSLLVFRENRVGSVDRKHHAKRNIETSLQFGPLELEPGKVYMANIMPPNITINGNKYTIVRNPQSNTLSSGVRFVRFARINKETRTIQGVSIVSREDIRVVREQD